MRKFPQLYAFHVLGGTFVGELISISGSGLRKKKKSKGRTGPNGDTTFARGVSAVEILMIERLGLTSELETIILA